MGKGGLKGRGRGAEGRPCPALSPPQGGATPQPQNGGGTLPRWRIYLLRMALAGPQRANPLPRWRAALPKMAAARSGPAPPRAVHAGRWAGGGRGAGRAWCGRGRSERAGPGRAGRAPCRSWPWTGWSCTRWCCLASSITSTGTAERERRRGAESRPGRERGPEGARGREGPRRSGTAPGPGGEPGSPVPRAIWA